LHDILYKSKLGHGDHDGMYFSLYNPLGDFRPALV